MPGRGSTQATALAISFGEAQVRLVRLFNRYQGELLAFFATMATADVVAPATGTHTLETQYRDLGATQ